MVELVARGLPDDRRFEFHRGQAFDIFNLIFFEIIYSYFRYSIARCLCRGMCSKLHGEDNTYKIYVCNLSYFMSTYCTRTVACRHCTVVWRRCKSLWRTSVLHSAAFNFFGPGGRAGTVDGTPERRYGHHDVSGLRASGAALSARASPAPALVARGSAGSSEELPKRVLSRFAVSYCTWYSRSASSPLNYKVLKYNSIHIKPYTIG